MPHLWLIGMMGAGKSTIGARLARRRGDLHVDLDDLVEQRAGRSIPELFTSDGEPAFRRLESAALAEVADSGRATVVSTGGGVVLDPANVDLMRSTGVVVYLEASVETLVRRLRHGRDRPLLEDDPATTIPALLEQRGERYRAAAHYVIDAGQRVADVVESAAGCAAMWAGPDSEILTGPTFPRTILPSSDRREQAVVIAHEGSRSVARSVMARLEAETDAIALLEVPDGEAAKQVAEVERLYSEMASLNVGRHDTVVGVGGGTVTDVAGFAAATWLRGIEWVAVPTTLLGAVDASIGGKTGVNLAGKNLVGAFWHPARVAISLSVLASLPEGLRRQGSAEAIKAGFIADPVIVELYREHGLQAPVGDVVRRAVAVKADVVSGDFREAGRRAILNFGHTIGHAIEIECSLPHGLAVAVGMVAAAAISQKRHGFDPDRVRQPLEALGLPTAVDGARRDSILDLVSRDKKRSAVGINMVLLRDLGDPVIEPVDSEDLEVGMAAIGIV